MGLGGEAACLFRRRSIKQDPLLGFETAVTTGDIATKPKIADGLQFLASVISLVAMGGRYVSPIYGNSKITG